MGDYVDADGIGRNFSPSHLMRVGARREEQWIKAWRARLPLRIPRDACVEYVVERILLALRGRKGFDRTLTIFGDVFGDPARADGLPRRSRSHEHFCAAVLRGRAECYLATGSLPLGGSMSPILHLTEKGLAYSREIRDWEEIMEDEGRYAEEKL